MRRSGTQRKRRQRPAALCTTNGSWISMLRALVRRRNELSSSGFLTGLCDNHHGTDEAFVYRPRARDGTPSATAGCSCGSFEFSNLSSRTLLPVTIEHTIILATAFAVSLVPIIMFIGSRRGSKIRIDDE
jgi:hypothetical protein